MAIVKLNIQHPYTTTTGFVFVPKTSEYEDIYVGTLYLNGEIVRNHAVYYADEDMGAPSFPGRVDWGTIITE